jgi:hypothetical protein
MDISKVDNLTRFMAYVVAALPYIFIATVCWLIWCYCNHKKDKEAEERAKQRKRARIAEEAKLKLRMMREMNR